MRRSSPTPTSGSADSTGERERAYEHLTTATAMYREMDIRYWLEKAEAAVKGLALPGERSDGQIRQGRHD